MNFDLMFARLLKWEGEDYVDDPVDRGGPSKFGISQKSYPDLNIKALTRAAAKQIYYNDYFMASPFNDITHERLREKLFDMDVNLGHKNACKCLQRALKAFGSRAQDDGIYGAFTKEKLQNVLSLDKGEEQLLAALKCEHASHYRSLIAKFPKFKKFETGWLKRAYS